MNFPFKLVQMKACLCRKNVNQTKTEQNVSTNSKLDLLILKSAIFPVLTVENTPSMHLLRTCELVNQMRAPLHLHTANSPWLSSLIPCLYSPPTMHCAAVMSVSAGCPSELHQRETGERIGPGGVERNINLLWKWDGESAVFPAWNPPGFEMN